MYTVIIKNKHTEGTTYSDRYRGALVKAAQEQHPDLSIVEELVGYCKDKNGNCYDFNHSPITSGYCCQNFEKLKSKQIPEIRLQLEPNNIR